MTPSREPDSQSREAGLSRPGGLLETIRRPEYTGEQRCWPCTALNIVLLALCCLVVALLWPPVAIIVAVVGLCAIVLRGYLFPYTPVVGPRIVEALPGTTFDKPEQPTGSLAESGTEDVGEQVFVELMRTGIVEEQGDEIGLSPAFRKHWEERISELRSGSLEEFERAVEVASGSPDVEVFEGSTGVFVIISTHSGKTYLSQHVALAETAALLVLEQDVPEMDRELRIAGAAPLRMFLETCPVCEEELVETEPTVCCSAARDPQKLPESILACRACDKQVYAFESV